MCHAGSAGQFAKVKHPLKKTKKQQAPTLDDKIRQMLTAKDTGKAAYGEADRLLAELIDGGLKPGMVVDMGNGEVAQVVDNFAKGNKAWKPCGINRYDLKVTRGGFKTANSPNPAPAAATMPGDAGKAQDVRGSDQAQS